MAAANRRIPDMRAVVSCGRIALSRKHGAVDHHSSHGRRQHAPRRRSWLASARTDPLSRRVLASCNATISCPRATVWKISPGPSNARGPLEARSPCAPGSEHSRSRRPVSRISRRCIARSSPWPTGAPVPSTSHTSRITGRQARSRRVKRSSKTSRRCSRSPPIVAWSWTPCAKASSGIAASSRIRAILSAGICRTRR